MKLRLLSEAEALDDDDEFGHIPSPYAVGAHVVSAIARYLNETGVGTNVKITQHLIDTVCSDLVRDDPVLRFYSDGVVRLAWSIKQYDMNLDPDIDIIDLWHYAWHLETEHGRYTLYWSEDDKQWQWY